MGNKKKRLSRSKSDSQDENWCKSFFALDEKVLKLHKKDKQNRKYVLSLTEKKLAVKMGFRNIEMNSEGYNSARRQVKCLLIAATMLNFLVKAPGGLDCIKYIFEMCSWKDVARICLATNSYTIFDMVKNNPISLKKICWVNTKFSGSLAFSRDAKIKNNIPCALDIKRLSQFNGPEDFYADYLNLNYSYNDWKIDAIQLETRKERIFVDYCYTTPKDGTHDPIQILFNPVFDLVVIKHSFQRVGVYR